MTVLELFAGSRSIGKAAQELGMNVLSTDIHAYDGIDLVCDIVDLRIKDLGPFDIVWASPPCTAFSVAAMGYHWNADRTPKTEGAKLGIRLAKKTLQIISDVQPKYWFIENPRGMLRKQNFMRELPRTTVWYCQYGDNRAKPTDIWSNNLSSLSKPNGFVSKTCYNGNRYCHHESAPRGSRTGTQGRKNNHERSKIPHALCLEILKSCQHDRRTD